MNSERDLGPLGQNTLKIWCNQVGITPQPPEEDKYGWDFLLEFKPESSSLPYDLRPTPVKCWVQVKSTDTLGSNRDVTLSNWQHLVYNSYPTFFLYLDFDGNIDCQRAYLVHVGEEYIYNVLKRLREKSVKDEPKELNRLTMIFDYSDADVLNELNGKSLKEKIEKYIPKGIDSYVKWKLEYRNKAGYEDGERQVNLRILVPENQQHRDREDVITDLALGRIPSLPTESGQIFETRFGIPSPEPEHKFSSGEFLATNLLPPTKASIVFTNPDYSKRVEIDGDFFLVHMGKYIKSEIRSPFLTIKIDQKFSSMGNLEQQDKELHIHSPKIDVAYPLAKLREFADLLVLMRHCCAQQSFINLKCTFSSVLESPNKGQWDIKLGYQYLAKIENLSIDGAQNIIRAYAIAKTFDIQDKLIILPSQLMKTNEELASFSNLLNPKPGVLISFNEDGELMQKDSIRFVQVLSLVLGSYKCILIFSASGKWEVNIGEVKGQIVEKTYTLETDNINIEKKCLLDIQDLLPFDIEQIQEEMSKKYPEDTLVILPFPE